jgi:hypothetical protein
VPWMSGVISAWATSPPAAQLRLLLIQLQQTTIQLFFSFLRLHSFLFFFFLPWYIYDVKVKLSLVDLAAKVFEWCLLGVHNWIWWWLIKFSDPPIGGLPIFL